MTRQEGLDLLAKYAWDTSDVARKEMTRYQSGPGQASAYMIGQLTIQKLRDYAEKALNESFNLKEFHYQVKNARALVTKSKHLNKLLKRKWKEILLFNFWIFQEKTARFVTFTTDS